MLSSSSLTVRIRPDMPVFGYWFNLIGFRLKLHLRQPADMNNSRPCDYLKIIRLLAGLNIKQTINGRSNKTDQL